jgi:hypothetical protein
MTIPAKRPAENNLPFLLCDTNKTYSFDVIFAYPLKVLPSRRYVCSAAGLAGIAMADRLRGPARSGELRPN